MRPSYPHQFMLLKHHSKFTKYFCENPSVSGQAKHSFVPSDWLFLQPVSGIRPGTLLAVNAAITTRWQDRNSSTRPHTLLGPQTANPSVLSVVLASARPFRSQRHFWPCRHRMSLGSHRATSLLYLYNNRYYLSYLIVLSKQHTEVEWEPDTT